MLTILWVLAQHPAIHSSTAKSFAICLYRKPCLSCSRQRVPTRSQPLRLELAAAHPIKLVGLQLPRGTHSIPLSRADWSRCSLLLMSVMTRTTTLRLAQKREPWATTRSTGGTSQVWNISPSLRVIVRSLMAHVGAVQYENWEAWPKERESCYRDSPRSQPCGQGRTSLYSVLAESAANIQAAVKFAAQYQLRLAIRNTGHDFIGRSAAPESLQIFTHKMKNITVVDHFVPSVPGGVKPPAPVQAVTIGAGVQLREMYAYLGTQGVMVVGGASNTVGVAGGYIQAGGHGILGHFAGMGSDNALEFTVVTANVSFTS